MQSSHCETKLAAHERPSGMVQGDCEETEFGELESGSHSRTALLGYFGFVTVLSLVAGLLANARALWSGRAD